MYNYDTIYLFKLKSKKQSEGGIFVIKQEKKC